MKGKKNWVPLYFNFWESRSFSTKNIIFNHNNERTNIEKIMKSLDFHSLNCHVNVEKNLGATKKIKKYISNDKYDYIITNLDRKDYYSDNSCINHRSDFPISFGIAKSTSYEKFFDSIDYDLAIPSEYIHKVFQDIKMLKSFVYSKRVLEVFKYEIYQIERSHKFTEKYHCQITETTKEMPYQFKNNLIEWITHFFPAYELFYEEKDLMNLFYEFVVKYNIPNKVCKDIFYKCMNVADQVASQSSFMNKKTAYYEDRLKYQHSSK